MTPTQARYLAYIKKYVDQHGIAPSEMEMARVMCVMPPSVNQMMKSPEKLGFISRSPGVARSIKILLPHELIPKWKRGGEVEIPEAAKKLPKLSTHSSVFLTERLSDICREAERTRYTKAIANDVEIRYISKRRIKTLVLVLTFVASAVRRCFPTMRPNGSRTS